MQSDLYKFVIGETRTDGWQSPWLKEQLRRRAEDAAKPRNYMTPQVKPIRLVKPTQPKRERAERRIGPPKPRYIPVVFTKFCSSCKAGLRKDTRADLCFKCQRARPTCACGKTVTLASTGTQCRECYHKGNKQKCALCSTLLNYGNQYGLCREHYWKNRGLIDQFDLKFCTVPGCDRQIRPSNKRQQCGKHSKGFYSARSRQLARAA